MLTELLAAGAASMTLSTAALAADVQADDLDTALAGGQVQGRNALAEAPAAAVPASQAAPQSYRRPDNDRYGREREITCRSGGGYARCNLGARIDSLRFVASRSTRNCDIGRDWGVEPSAVWVDNGCRATFLVSTYSGGYSGQPGRPGGGYGYGDDYNEIRYVKCESDNRRRHICRLPRDFSRVRLENRHSDAPCHQGRDWGTTREGIWVDNGCRATFSYISRDRY